jgi:threonylcarbamoyladenosine tRNA methylthiotransferase MtaB
MEGSRTMKEIKNRVAFLTLGCKVNTYETNAMQRLFKNAGYSIVEFSDVADIYVVNTCSVTNMADRKSRQMLHKAKKSNPEGVVVAVGCYVQSAKEKLEEDTAIDVIIGNSQKHLIVPMVEKYLEDHQYKSFIVDVSKNPTYETLQIEDAGERTRAFIKIQDGCNQFCSYCIIPYARGRVRSRKEEDIVEEVQGLVKNGYKEIVLNGIHLSSYGADEQNKDFMRLEGKPLLHIISKINEIEGVERIRLGSLEPRVITEQFVTELKKNEKVCPHFHLSLQSGCDETLKRMNRKYTTKEYLQGCEILRKHYEHPAITTDVIVGFPAETKEEFEITRKFLEKVHFSKMHIFKYSIRQGTRAEQMKPQIADSVKALRSNELLQLDETLEQSYRSYFIGREEKVLFEEEVEINGEQYYLGHNERYVKIAIPRKGNPNFFINQVVPVCVTGNLDKDIMLGKMG